MPHNPVQIAVSYHDYMNVVLFTWNPDKWEIGHREWSRNIRQVADLGGFYGRWSTGSTTFIEQGDVALLLRQSRDRGIVARGTVISDIYEEASWNENDEEGAMSSYVDINWTEVLPIDRRLTIETLKSQLPDVSWVRFSSGTTVDSKFHGQLLDLWGRTVTDAGVSSQPTGTLKAAGLGPPASPKLIALQRGTCGLCGLDASIMYSLAPDDLLREVAFVNGEVVAACPTCASAAAVLLPGRWQSVTTPDEFRRLMSTQH
jgi:hypothetical protein